MPDNNKTPVRSFKIDGQVFDIPESKVNDFLNDAPEAEEIRSYTVGKDTFDIPVPQVEEFLTDAPEAKPVQQYPEQQENTADYGPFDKETVEKYPQARQNFERWQKGQTTARQDSVEPTIDPNAVNFKDENFKKPTPETKDDDLTGFWQEIGKRGHRSAIELNKMLANAPDFVNRIAVQAFNASPPGQAIQGIGEIVGQNWKMEAKDLRPEQFNEYSEKQKEQLTKKIAEINPKHEQGIIESAKKGDWITFTRNLAGGVADSFAPSLAMMISGAGMAAPGMISSGAAVFGAGKYDEMDKAAPNMTEDAKVMAAAANGAFEGIFETYLGSGAVGKAFRKIIEQEGKQAAKGVVQRGLSKGFSDLLSKYPALAPLGEGFEEMGTQVAQNVVDKYSGYRPDISITEGVADAGAIGMAAGASHSAPLYATKKVVDGIAGTPQQPTGPNQPQAPVDPEGQAPTVNPEQQLNALREQYRQEAAGKLDEFKHKTGNIVTGVDHKGNTYFVKDGDRADEDGMLIVYDENGKKEQIHENNISDWVTTDYESALEAQMQAFDQQVEQRLRPQVNDKVNYQGQPHIILEDNGDSYTLADMQGNPVDNVPKQTIIQENQAQQPAEATEGQQPGVQPQEQPQPKPVVTETIGGNKYGFTENEDGSLDLVIPENAEPQKLLTQLEKEFKDNPDWEVRAEKEVVEVPPESRFQRPTQREIIRNIQVAPKNNQNVTGQTSQENKTSEINPELKQQVEAETQPSYQYRGQEIDRETAQGLIEVAAMQENPEKLNDLVVNNDEQLTKLMQKSFPEKKPSYKLGNRNLTPTQAKAAILAAETPEELSRVKIQNDNQFDELLQQKEEEFNQAAQKEQEQRNREHDYLVSKLRTHNNLSEGIRQRANTSQIVQKAAQLGYTVKPGNKGKLIVTNENGSEIQYTPDRTSSQKKNQHPTLQEYDNDFQQKVETILSPAALTGVELGDLRPAEVKQGVIDIQAGKKTVPANRLLDELENSYNSGVVEWKGDRTTGERGPQMSFDEFVNFWQGSELNEQEQAAAEQIPEETADAILDDEGELTPEMWHELYNQYVNLEQNEQETGSVQETETSETATEQTEGETGTESAEIIENDSKQEEKLTETESQQPEQQTSEEISEDRSLQNREEISETGEERLQNWWEEYDVVNEITDFSGQKQQGEWIKIANAYFPLSEVQKYNSKDELLAAKLKEGETQQQSTDVQENLTTEQEGVKETELTPEETEIYNQAKTVVDNSLKNTTPEEMQKAKTGSGFAAAKFAMRYTSPEKNQRLYNAIYNLYFDAVKNYPTEQVSGNLTNETTKAEQPENRGKEATKKTFKLPIEKNLEQAEERVEKKKQDNEAIKSATKTPRTVRELADLEAEKQQGLISGVILSSLEKNDSFKVGRDKTYTVTRKTKPKKVEYSREKHSGQYDRTTVTITDNEGKKYTYELWDNWIQDGNKMVSTIHRKGATRKSDMVGQLSRDIEGDINLDLINENNQLHEKTDSYKIIEKELNRINKEQPEVDEEVGNKTPEQKPETPENQSEPQQEVGSNVGSNEYKYHLRSRPFSIGTYPQNDNFVRHEEDNTPFGKVIYSEPLSIKDVKKFELVPEGQVEAGDYVMSLGNNEYPVRVEVVKNQKGQDAVKLTNEENGFNQNMSAVDFMEQLQEGKFIKAPQNKPESKFFDDKVEQAGKKKPKRKSFTQQVKKGLNEKEIDRLDELRNKLRNKLGGQLNAGLDPETFMMAAEATGLVIKSGMRQFSDYASSMVDLLGNKIKPHLKALYEYTKRADSAEFIDKMTPTNEVDNADIDEILQQSDESNVNLDNENNQQDVSDRTGNSEQDSGRNADDVRPDQNDVPSDRGRSGNTGTSNQGTGRTGNQKQEGSQGRIDLFTPTDGERSDSGISEKDEGLQSETENAGNTDTERGSDNRTEGNNDERTGNHSDRGSNQKDNKSTKSFAERVKENLKKQKAAENVPVKPTNRENISETLPFLLEEQQDDVYKAEKRYYNPDQKTHEKAYGKGMLFTNGTGTGKTYTGLGVIKRFIKQGKNRILIVVPSQPKVSDWIEDAKNLNINVNGLKDTQDKGEGVVITTYANMRANMKLMEEDFDLVVYDESHRLMEDKNGNPSSTTYAHYNISNKSKDQALARLKMVHPLWKKELDLEKQIRREGERRANPDLMEEMYQESLAKEKELEAELKEVNEQQKKVLPDLEKRAQKAYENTKVLFLSATPFKMHFNLRYANGYLYDWGEEITYESASRGQSRVDAESRFFLDNFGSAYEWKYHRLQKKSDANPQAVAMQEAEFAEKLMKSGAMSGRAIESEQDYSREFPLVALDKSELINRAYSDIYNYSTKEFSELTTAAGEVFHNYNYTTKLFESLKTSMVLPRVKEHIKLGRKVVLFHRRRQSGVAPPFQTVLNTTRINAKFVLNDPDSNQKSKDQAEEALRQADAFEEKYGELLEYEQNLNYNSAIDQVVEEFGVDRVRFINGTVSKKDKNKAVIDFNNDNSGVDIIVVQEEAGKEGISLHDTTGKHQRVEISLSMPISSITALQMEGRIYRIGQETDAIFEYPLLGLDLEVAYFGQNINRRLSTTENLAVGNQSRDLIRSFAEGVLFNSSADSPNVEQGKGGKEYDKKEVELQSEFQRARLVYQTNQKQRGRRDQRKGIDYYPTPEPVGQKMVEWLGLESGETGLEPSAGHGAIAMWFPDRAKVTAIEPAYGLYSKLTARVGGAEPKVINDTFENHHVVNKYDGIAMNPPFGQGGKTAMDHIEKAFSHLREGGRIVAIVPNGGSMQKRLDKFFAAENDKGKLVNPDAVLKAEIEMPGVMFDQAGTKINSKIIVIDKVPIKSERQIRDEVRRESNQRALDGGALMTLEEISQEVDRRMRAQIANREWTYPSHDFKDIENINELFDVIEDLELPERTKPEGSSQPQAGPAVTEQNTDKPKYEIFEQKHSQTGEDLFMAMPTEYLGKDTFRELKQLAKKHDGYYSSYQNKANNVKRGFTFKSEESRNKFVAEAQKDDTGIRLRVSEPLYSPTERALERIKQEKGTPEQFKSMLLKNGAKQAELDWMGFDEFSQDKKSLTKQEIQEWIDGNKVEIEEVEKGEGQTTTDDAVMNLPEDGKLNVMYIPVTEKLKKVATEQGMPLFKDTESQFITDRIHNNKLKALFQKYFESAKNTGTIHVVTSPQEVPAEFRQKQTLKGTQGFYDVNTGETYFITGNIQDPAEAFKTWVHEVGVHRGLSNIIPPAELNSFFQKIYDDIGSEEIKANIPESYHELDPTEQAEEYLAFLGEKVVNEKDLTPREKGVWQRIIDTVKNILNKLFTGARYTTKDAENVVKAAVQSVYRPPTGQKTSKQTSKPETKGRFLDDVISQPKQTPITETEAFRDWFGDSKVVDENGKPLVVYHGTDSEFNEFDTPSYFTDDEYVAEFYSDPPWRDSNENVVQEVYLSIQNPKTIDLNNKSWDSIDINEEIENAINNDYDGLILENVMDGESSPYPQTQYIAFSPTQIKSATGNRGTFDRNNPDIRYRKTSDKLEDAQSAILNSDGFINDNIEALRAATEAYNEQAPGKVPLKKSLEQMREFWIDQNMPIRRWEEEIKKRGGKQDDNSKPYRDIRNMFGRMEALYRKFQDQKMNPIKDSIVKLVDSGIDSKSILPYIIAKHGLERNRVMRQNRLDEWKLNYEAKNGEKPSQEMTEAQAAKLEGQDFSGLKPFDTNDKFDNVDDLARSIVDGFEQQAEDKLLNEFWDNIRSATSYTLETWKEGGQISEKEYEKLKKQYKHFVPLRGWREDAAKFLNYKDNEGGIGKSLKRALGRKSLADNPFAYIQSVAFKAINEQVTNEIKQSAFRLVFNNYGGDFKDLHQIKRAYLVRKEIWNEETEQNEEAWVLYRDENGNLARPPKEMFDEGDVKIEFNNDHEKLRTIWNAKQHEVVVRNNGGFSVMIFPDSQLSVAQSLNNQNTMANFLGHSFDARKLGETWLFRGLGSVTNFMKGMMTSYNPVFPATNFFRDQPEAALTQFIRGNARVADFPTKYTPIAAKAIIENIAGKNKNGKYVEELRNFYEAGGTTGFTHEKRVEQLEKELKKEIDRALRASTTKGKTIDKLTHILDYIEHWNRIFEDTTRFAVYLSARDKGMTVRDAAFQSRTASVDFNMKGKGTRVVESFFAFFKAGINALQKNAKLGKDHPKRFAATAAGVATLGLLEALVNDWIDDDDEYYRLNDYVRQNYFVLQKWWGDENEYLRIPLPQFWRGFHALGVSVYDYAKGKSTLGEAIGQTVSNMIAGMAPIDVTGFIHEGKFSSDPLWPTSIKPIREIVVNRNFMGSQIAMEPFTKSLEEDLSDSGLHKRNVNPLIKFVTDMMFKAAGGEGKLKFKMTEDGELKYVVDALDVNPSKIEHFINGYLGGTSKFLNDFVTTLWQFGDTEEEFDINNAPFLNSFIRNVPEEKWGILREYQAFEDAIQDADKYRSTAQSDMNAEGMKKFYRSDYAEAKAVYDIYDSAISDIMEAYGFDSEEAAKEVTDLMKEAIDKFEQLNIKEK